MARSILNLLSNTGAPFRENPFHLMGRDAIPITVEDWNAAAPSGNSGSAFRLQTTYVEPSTIAGEPDFEMDVTLRFVGAFSKNDGDWSGPIRKLQVFVDGEKVGTISLRGNLAIEDVFGETDSGTIWDALSLDGFSGRLTGEYDYFSASNGRDVLNAGGGNDVIFGFEGNDRISGKGGNDMLHGQKGDDRLIGGAGNDTLDGGEHDDVLLGGGGQDLFRAENGFGQDTWTGGRGADRFEIGFFREGDLGATVTDFNRRQGDQVDLSQDEIFFFQDFDEIVYIGSDAFTGTEGRYEIRMEDGLVEVDSNGDGEMDQSILLDGQGSFTGNTNWLLLPDGFDFG
ncbi:hypothetical protein PXK01_02465 [Phaeobacter sp. PT47_59]|nr:hypothetical protein [Phaeobacter sp. PT47_59]